MSSTCLKCRVLIVSSTIVAVVGFEQTDYTVVEEEGSVEICVAVTNPPPEQVLIFDILLLLETSTGTASELLE